MLVVVPTNLDQFEMSNKYICPHKHKNERTKYSCKLNEKCSTSGLTDDLRKLLLNKTLDVRLVSLRPLFSNSRSISPKSTFAEVLFLCKTEYVSSSHTTFLLIRYKYH